MTLQSAASELSLLEEAAREAGALARTLGEIGDRREPPWAVVEVFAGDVHIVGVENAVNEARRHPLAGEPGGAIGDALEKTHGLFRRRETGEIRVEMEDAIIDKRGDCARVASGSVVLKEVEACTTVAGVPARYVGPAGCPEPARSMNQMVETDGVSGGA